MCDAGILVVEDDDAIASGLVRVLSGQGYTVSRVDCGREALAATSPQTALVLLDLGLQDMDGLDVCRLLRTSRPDIAILILTARSTELDVVAGLDAGADDYLVKPFRLSELLARVRAHIRRACGPGRSEAESTVTAGSVTIDLAARRAWCDDVELRLRPKEFDLLVLLATEAGRVVTRERIMREVWATGWHGATKTLDTHILTLRGKLGDPSPITTLRGVGYRLDVA